MGVGHVSPWTTVKVHAKYQKMSVIDHGHHRLFYSVHGHHRHFDKDHGHLNNDHGLFGRDHSHQILFDIDHGQLNDDYGLLGETAVTKDFLTMTIDI